MVVRSGLGLMLLAPAILVAGCQSAAPPVESASAQASSPPAIAQPRSTPVPLPRKPVSVPKRPPALEYIKRKLVRSNLAQAPKTLTVEASEVPSEPTRILNRAGAERLFGNSGLTLQWVGWDKRGKAWVAVDEGGVWWLSGEHRNEENSGLKLEGYVSEIGEDYFLFNGEITIIGTPDRGRMCDVNKEWRFGITQNRKYWRLREFEWCDRSTDYIDIYF